MKTILLSFLFIFLATNLLADGDGPFAPPCQNCPEFGATWAPYPQTGLWYNPERSGTGINIDVQGGIMAAVYYGYREDGEPVWYIFSGELEPSDAEDAYWDLEANLYKASNGEPVNGEHRRPDTEVIGSIHVEVIQRNLLRFSIDDGPYQRMVPQIFGSHYFQPFEPDSDVRLPDFTDAGVFGGTYNDETPWLIVQINPEGNIWDYGHTYWKMHWASAAHGISQGLPAYLMGLFSHDNVGAMSQSGIINCAPGAWHKMFPPEPPELDDEAPVCSVKVFRGNQDTEDEDRLYWMPLGNLGDRRFSAASEDGWRVEGFRLMYD